MEDIYLFAQMWSSLVERELGYYRGTLCWKVSIRTFLSYLSILLLPLSSLRSNFSVSPADLLLRIGEYDLANEEEPYGFQERRVQIIASHPQFDPRTFEYDLALLRFYEPLPTFQPNVLPICLPDDDETYVGRTAYVTGWGRLYDGSLIVFFICPFLTSCKKKKKIFGKPFLHFYILRLLLKFSYHRSIEGPLPSILQEVAVPVINNTVCEAMYRNAGYIEHIPHIFICAGWRNGGFDSCEVRY